MIMNTRGRIQSAGCNSWVKGENATKKEGLKEWLKRGLWWENKEKLFLLCIKNFFL